VLFGRTAFYTRGAMDFEGIGNIGANHLLQTEAIAAACEAGCTRYHMGDATAGTGLARYKSHFGAQPLSFVTYRLERVPLTRIDRRLRDTVRSVLGVEANG
jgi:lipid II:glycine glycyltransferase (peptidoglycan interpeptide bridge formation enzyme)